MDIPISAYEAKLKDVNFTQLLQYLISDIFSHMMYKGCALYTLRQRSLCEFISICHLLYKKKKTKPLSAQTLSSLSRIECRQSWVEKIIQKTSSLPGFGNLGRGKSQYLVPSLFSPFQVCICIWHVKGLGCDNVLHCIMCVCVYPTFVYNNVLCVCASHFHV